MKSFIPFVILLQVSTTYAFTVSPSLTKSKSFVTSQRQVNNIFRAIESSSSSSIRSRVLQSTVKETNEFKDDEIERLKSMAARLRAEAASLEAQQAQQMASVVEKAFQQFDTNQDGQISMEELKAGLEKAFKVELSEKRVQQLMADFDKTGDGTTIQKQDFVTLDKFRNRLDQLARDEKQMAIDMAKKAKVEEELSQFLQAQMERINDREPTLSDKLISCLPYLFPLLDGLQYGRFLILDNIDNPLAVIAATIYALYRSIPFGGLIAFFALSTLAGNPSINRLVRFNMQQAIFVDVALFFPGLIAALFSIVGGAGGLGVPESLTALGSDLIFFTLLATLSYAVISSLFGVTPNKIPLISSSVEARMPSIDMFDDQGRFKPSKKDDEKKDS